LRGHVIVLWDNGRIHEGDPLRDLCRRYPRLHPEQFPSYAPELNPDEGVWILAKRSLANGGPDGITELEAHLTDVFRRLRPSPARLRACITRSEPPRFLPW